MARQPVQLSQRPIDWRDPAPRVIAWEEVGAQGLVVILPAERERLGLLQRGALALVPTPEGVLLERGHQATVVDGVGLIEALRLGPCTDSEAYDMAIGLRDAGVLTDDELTELWDALAILDVLAEQVGLDGWDLRPEPASEGMRRAAVASGLLDEETAAPLSRDEVEAAIAAG